MANSSSAAQRSYSFGLVTALPKEFAAVRTMLDNPTPCIVAGDPNDYVCGTIPAQDGSGEHQIVLTLLKKPGNNSAASAASHLLRSFPSIDHVLLIGIAGGLPHPTDPDKHVRLGDVVVSNQYGVIQYDHVKRTSRKSEVRDSSAPPSAILLGKVNLLESARIGGERPWEAFIPRATSLENSARPDPSTDVLFDAKDPKLEIPHPADPQRTLNQPRIHYGRIGSANMLLKSPALRDRLRDRFGVRAIEMEGSGLADGAWMARQGYLIVRGISDYCDRHKSDTWQGYASAAAAGYARALIASFTVDVRPPVSVVQQNPPTDEAVKSLSLRCLARVRDRKAPLGASHRHVPRADVSKAFDDFLKSDKRVLILKGLPGSGKTTALLDVAQQQQYAFITALSDVGQSERWSAQLDREVVLEVGSPSTPFLSLCRALVERLDDSPIVILVDELERCSSPAATIEQIVADLSDLPANVKAIVAIRWANFSTQAEAQLLSRNDVVLHTVAELDSQHLSEFLAAYDLPSDLPRGVRNVLRTPFAVRVFSGFGAAKAGSFANLGDMMGRLFEQLFSSSKAKELFLDAIGSAATASNSVDAMGIKDIMAAAARNSVPLAISDCDSDLPTSALRFFIDKGILLEDRDGIRATHDLWMECLVARALRSVLKEKGPVALLDLLLEHDFGVRWSSVLIMPGIIREADLADLAQRLVAVVGEYLAGMTDEERKLEQHSSLMLKHMTLGNSQPAPLALRHLLEMRRSSNTGNSAVLLASRAAEVLTIMFAAVPNVVGPAIQSSDDGTASWLLDALMPKVVVDPFVVSLVNVANRQAVLLVLRMTHSLARASLGVHVMGGDKPVTVKAFEGPRLPTIFPRRAMDGFHLLMPHVFEYLPAVFPGLLPFAGDGTDDYIMGHLELIADYVSVAISMHDDPTSEWVRLVARIPAESLAMAGWILASTYPHVQPTTLLRASVQRLQYEPSEFEQLRKFGSAVVIQGMHFVLLGVDAAPTERRLLQFAHAIEVWSLDVTVNGTAVLEDHAKKISIESERLAVRCLVFLSFHLRHMAASCESPQEDERFTRESANAAQRYLVSSLKHEVDAARENLISSLKLAYGEFRPQTDPSRLPLELAEWLQAHGRTAEAADAERVGHLLTHVCDRVFGVPS